MVRRAPLATQLRQMAGLLGSQVLQLEAAAQGMHMPFMM